MKKLILGIVFVFATGTMMNANSSYKDMSESSSKTIEIVEDFGCARNCVDYALETIQPMRDDGGWGLERELGTYMVIYEICYNRNCA